MNFSQFELLIPDFQQYFIQNKEFLIYSVLTTTSYLTEQSTLSDKVVKKLYDYFVPDLYLKHSLYWLQEHASHIIFKFNSLLTLILLTYNNNFFNNYMGTQANY